MRDQEARGIAQMRAIERLADLPPHLPAPGARQAPVHQVDEEVALRFHDEDDHGRRVVPPAERSWAHLADHEAELADWNSADDRLVEARQIF